MIIWSLQKSGKVDTFDHHRKLLDENRQNELICKSELSFTVEDTIVIQNVDGENINDKNIDDIHREIIQNENDKDKVVGEPVNRNTKSVAEIKQKIKDKLKEQEAKKVVEIDKIQIIKNQLEKENKKEEEVVESDADSPENVPIDRSKGKPLSNNEIIVKELEDKSYEEVEIQEVNEEMQPVRASNINKDSELKQLKKKIQNLEVSNKELTERLREVNVVKKVSHIPIYMFNYPQIKSWNIKMKKSVESLEDFTIQNVEYFPCFDCIILVSNESKFLFYEIKNGKFFDFSYKIENENIIAVLDRQNNENFLSISEQGKIFLHTLEDYSLYSDIDTELLFAKSCNDGLNLIFLSKRNELINFNLLTKEISKFPCDKKVQNFYFVPVKNYLIVQEVNHLWIYNFISETLHTDFPLQNTVIDIKNFNLNKNCFLALVEWDEQAEGTKIFTFDILNKKIISSFLLNYDKPIHMQYCGDSKTFTLIGAEPNVLLVNCETGTRKTVSTKNKIYSKFLYIGGEQLSFAFVTAEGGLDLWAYSKLN